MWLCLGISVSDAGTVEHVGVVHLRVGTLGLFGMWVRGSVFSLRNLLSCHSFETFGKDCYGCVVVPFDCFDVDFCA